MRVRERRQELGLSQATLAQRLGVTRQWVASLEHGKRTVEAGKVLATLRALGLVVDVRARSEQAASARAVRSVSTQWAGGGQQRTGGAKRSDNLDTDPTS